jgi:DNA-binding CsgD family transcriptional regulator
MGGPFSFKLSEYYVILNIMMAIREGSRLRPGCGMRSLLLSIRETTVLRMVADGMSNKAISEALEISVRTVEAHRSRLRLKLNLGSINELVRYAIRNHLVSA